MRRLTMLVVVMLVVGVLPAPVAFGQSDPAKPEATKPETQKVETKKAAANKVEKKPASKPVAAVFTLDGPIVEKPMEEDFPFAEPGIKPLKDLVARLEEARDDQQVKAVVLLMDEAYLDLAQIEELRQAIDSVKAKGKPVFAHVDSLLYTQNYALAAGASELSITPTAIIMIMGFSAESPYVRGLLDWIDVKPDFLTCGEYKSAAEMFMRQGPSPAAQRMEKWLLDSLYESYLGMIAKGRRVPVEQARLWINEGLYSPERAKELRIVDRIEHRQDFAARLKAKYGEDLEFDKDYGKEKEEEIDLSSPLAMFKIWAEILQGGKKKAAPKNSVAIVYVDGPIMPGKADPSPFGSISGAYSTTIRKALDKAAEDENVKAVVLRVNSPGGSAVASEIILNATKRVGAKKPFVVSMGSVAGSGGYYVSCGTDTIFADATTITASIGVVGGKFATTEMWNKIGITWDIQRRGANAGLLSSDEVFSEEERKQMQDWMDEIYGVFKGHVVAARGKKLKKPIDELAGGRVFTGKQALDLGLVDKIGTLDDAVEHVAKKASLEDYELISLPEPKNFFEMLFDEMSGKESDNHRLAIQAGVLASPPTASIVELALPHLKGLDPRRAEAIKNALRRLDMLQQERVLLTMPQIDIRP